MNTKELEDLNVLFTFRKTLLVSILYAIGILFRLKGFIDGGQFVDLMKNVTVAFLASNGFEYAASTARTYFNQSTSTTVVQGNAPISENGATSQSK